MPDDQFRGQSISDIISRPLQAAAEAQAKLMDTYHSFMGALDVSSMNITLKPAADVDEVAASFDSNPEKLPPED